MTEQEFLQLPRLEAMKLALGNLKSKKWTLDQYNRALKKHQSLFLKSTPVTDYLTYHDLIEVFNATSLKEEK